MAHNLTLDSFPLRQISSFLPALIAPLLRVVGWTWRIRVNNLAGLSANPEESAPAIWVLWHNRLLIIPILYQRFFRRRKGAALISRSKDGELLASCIHRFGGEAVRGSSSRGGASALAQLKRKLTDGYDIYITPDGPRGPRYSSNPGAVWLAQSSGAKILPLSVEYSSFWRLGRWDGFIIPKPFSTVTVTLHPFHEVPPCDDDSQIEGERQRLHDQMMAGTGLR